ncbi:hypothetical protein RvY_13083 [Ramazzottius varieornatus]|uniref:Uncharacterized protein n=1 Tax=Ramazzottius varieornatus TaxID=947166 RepID=A0A1D1VLQ1_RAMVA|nr:hypothetical protein RvY_13083 [Ramazzottius varieornatus]
MLKYRFKGEVSENEHIGKVIKPRPRPLSREKSIEVFRDLQCNFVYPIHKNGQYRHKETTLPRHRELRLYTANGTRRHTEEYIDANESIDY